MKRYAELLAVAVRGDRIESEHFGHVAICDVDGKLIRSRGDADRPIFLRSSAKPLQAISCILAGAADRYAWTNAQLAVVCASHAAEDAHLLAVQQILVKADLLEDQLGCGPHAPFSESARDRLLLTGKRPTRLHNNCSGKHAGMLAACRHAGWDTDAYLRLEHPLQQANLATLCRFAGCTPPSVPTAIDGCGVPTFQISVAQTASAFARLTNAERLDSADRSAANRVVEAMLAEPWQLAGSKIFNTALMEFGQGKIVAKLGAEGVFGIGLPGLGVGIAIKIADGSARVHPVVVANELRPLLPELDWDRFLESTSPAITNTRGELVGEYRAAI